MKYWSITCYKTKCITNNGASSSSIPFCSLDTHWTYNRRSLASPVQSSLVTVYNNPRTLTTTTTTTTGHRLNLVARSVIKLICRDVFNDRPQCHPLHFHPPYTPSPIHPGLLSPATLDYQWRRRSFIVKLTMQLSSSFAILPSWHHPPLPLFYYTEVSNTYHPPHTDTPYRLGFGLVWSGLAGSLRHRNCIITSRRKLTVIT